MGGGGYLARARSLREDGALGFLGLTYPEEYGGQGLDFWYTTVLCEELARINCAGVPMGISVHTDMCTPALAHFGSHELKQRFLEPSIRGEMVGCIGVTEPDAGSDVAAIRTRAEADGDDWVINGRKLYITNGTQADWVCLLARTSDEGGYRGMSLIMVPTNTPGFSVSRKLRKLGNRSSDTAELCSMTCACPRRTPSARRAWASSCRCSSSSASGWSARFSPAPRANASSATLSPIPASARRFGQPLIDNQVIHFRLCELLTEIELLQASSNYHCVEHDGGWRGYHARGLDGEAQGGAAGARGGR